MTHEITVTYKAQITQVFNDVDDSEEQKTFDWYKSGRLAAELKDVLAADDVRVSDFKVFLWDNEPKDGETAESEE